VAVPSDQMPDAWIAQKVGPGAPTLTERLLLNALINSVPDYLFVKDTKSRFVIANRPVAEDLGLTVPDLIGKTDFDLHDAALARKFFDEEQEVIRTGRPQIDVEQFVITTSGQTKWMSTSKWPLRDASDEIVGIVGVCRDISERKHAEAALAASESRWHLALDGAGQGVWDHDLRNKTAFFSPVWRQMRGIGLTEEIDPSRDAWLARVHPDDRPRIIDETHRQNSGELKQNTFEYRERHRDGHWMWILSRGRAVEWMPDGSVARIIGTDTDITSLKESEARAATEKLMAFRQQQKAKEEFIATVSHELRTPLSAIKGSLDLIAAGAGGELAAKAKHLVQIAQRNCSRLAGLVNDILDIEKLESDKELIAPSTVNLRSAIEEAVTASAGYLPEREIVWEIRDEVPGALLLADPGRLAQVLANLLSNAVKFSPRGGTVVVELTRGPIGLSIGVLDQGPGVPPEFEPRLFSKFEQADSSDTRANGGTGLGLSISKALVERMGGTIAYHRRENRTEFMVILTETTARDVGDNRLSVPEVKPQTGPA
jgi:PAS domain S-box-containing protein